ncbi:unnamed protein product [Amoebophrya sp. A25]|nr:unnamed protein product [Amoebophrya sp. A25]|eukprot:GSA25T00005679001.1
MATVTEQKDAGKGEYSSTRGASDRGPQTSDNTDSDEKHNSEDSSPPTEQVEKNRREKIATRDPWEKISLVISRSLDVVALSLWLQVLSGLWVGETSRAALFSSALSDVLGIAFVEVLLFSVTIGLRQHQRDGAEDENIQRKAKTTGGHSAVDDSDLEKRAALNGLGSLRSASEEKEDRSSKKPVLRMQRPLFATVVFAWSGFFCRAALNIIVFGTFLMRPGSFRAGVMGSAGAALADRYSAGGYFRLGAILGNDPETILLWVLCAGAVLTRLHRCAAMLFPAFSRSLVCGRLSVATRVADCFAFLYVGVCFHFRERARAGTLVLCLNTLLLVLDALQVREHNERERIAQVEHRILRQRQLRRERKQQREEEQRAREEGQAAPGEANTGETDKDVIKKNICEMKRPAKKTEVENGNVEDSGRDVCQEDHNKLATTDEEQKNNSKHTKTDANEETKNKSTHGMSEQNAVERQVLVSEGSGGVSAVWSA